MRVLGLPTEWCSAGHRTIQGSMGTQGLTPVRTSGQRAMASPSKAVFICFEQRRPALADHGMAMGWGGGGTAKGWWYHGIGWCFGVPTWWPHSAARAAI